MRLKKHSLYGICMHISRAGSLGHMTGMQSEVDWLKTRLLKALQFGGIEYEKTAESNVIKAALWYALTEGVTCWSMIQSSGFRQLHRIWWAQPVIQCNSNFLTCRNQVQQSFHSHRQRRKSFHVGLHTSKIAVDSGNLAPHKILSDFMTSSCEGWAHPDG